MSKLTPKKVEAYLEWLSWFNAKIRKPKKVKIETEYKDKKLIVQFRESYLHNYLNCFSLYGKETTKEMFDKAIEYFSIRQNEVGI